jgi:hypothetical protein
MVEHGSAQIAEIADRINVDQPLAAVGETTFFAPSSLHVYKP